MISIIFSGILLALVSSQPGCVDRIKWQFHYPAGVEGNRLTTKTISVGTDGTVMATDSNGGMWQYDKTEMLKGNINSWNRIGSSNVYWRTVDIATANLIYAVGTKQPPKTILAGNVWQRYKPGDDFVWAQFHEDDYLTDISVAPDATVYGVYAPEGRPDCLYQGEVFKLESDGIHWNQINGAWIKNIAVGSANNVWAIGKKYCNCVLSDPDPANCCYHWDCNSDNEDKIFKLNTADDTWIEMPGRLSQISVAWDGTIMGVTFNSLIYRYIPSTNSWEHICGYIQHISVGSKNEIWGADAYGNVWSGIGDWGL